MSGDELPTYLDLYRDEVRPREQPSLKDRAKWTDKAIVFLTFGIVLFACLQYLVTLDAGGQTDRIIAADERLAKAMEQSVSTASTALNASIDNFHLQQRAWMGSTGIAGVAEVGQPFNITLGFKNSGNTPARNVSVTIVGEPVPSGKKPNFDRELTVKRESRGVIPPGGDGYASFPETKDENLNDAARKDIASKTVTVYVHGMLWYDDIFTGHHWLSYCYYLLPNGKNYATCPNHNDTDQ